MITVAYDKEVDITYVKFNQRPVFETEQIEEILIDLDRKGHPVGLEFFGRPREMIRYIERETDLSEVYAEVSRLLNYYS